MSQASPTIGAGKSGLVYRQEDNDGKKALLTQHKGASAPAYAEAGMIWLDDSATPWRLKFYDGSDWIVMGALHAGNNSFLPYNGTDALRLCGFAPDTGEADACAVNPVPAPPQHQSGQMVVLVPAYDNTGAATLALSALDIKDITLDDGTALGAGHLKAGQVYLLIYDGTRFVVLNPTRTAGVPAGSMIACQYATYSTYAVLTSIIPHDNTVPQASEGTQILSVTLSPQSASNRVRIRFSGFGTVSGAHSATAFLSIDGGAAVQAVSSYGHDAASTVHLGFEFEHVPGDTAPHTYSVRVGPGSSGSLRMNGGSSARLFGGAAAATLYAEEIKA
ncbi:MAG: hypothetical protein H3C49_00010 [Alphaproteobacteria bacterium]|nr:hypothetical protein [Alphaproteobacteria bacterium]